MTPEKIREWDKLFDSKEVTAEVARARARIEIAAQLSELNQNVVRLFGIKPAVETPCSADAGEHSARELTTVLRDLFAGKKITAMVNGVPGQAGFFSEDAKVAYAAKIIEAYAASRVSQLEEELARLKAAPGLTPKEGEK